VTASKYPSGKGSVAVISLRRVLRDVVGGGRSELPPPAAAAAAAAVSLSWAFRSASGFGIS